jgi:predicted dehydrogenase
VVGLGFGQAVHVPAFRSDPRSVVVGVAGSSRERAKTVADRLQIPKAFGDWREMVADPEIEILSVAVPPALQPSVVCAAARAGKHVFCEKPGGTDVGQVQEMLAAVEKAGVVHAIDFLFPEIPAWQRAKELLREGRMGQPRQVALTWRVLTAAHREKRDTWKRRAVEGGGTLGNFVSHSLYYLEWLLGPISALNARLGPRETADESRVDAWLEFKNGCSGSLSVAADAFLGSGHRLEIYDDHGTLVLENHSPDYVRGFSLSMGTRENGRLAPVTVDDPAEGGDGRVAATAGIVRRFLDAIEAGASVTPSLHDGLRVQMLIGAMRAADALGAWQSL